MQNGKVSPFRDVTLRWGEAEYVVPASRVMGAIASIEEHVTLVELFAMQTDPGKMKLVPISRAYAAVLRYAGAVRIDQDDVYESLFGADSLERAQSAIVGLLSLMIPPGARREGAPDEGKSERPAEARPSRRPSSSRASRRRAAAGG